MANKVWARSKELEAALVRAWSAVVVVDVDALVLAVSTAVVVVVVVVRWWRW